MKAMSTRVRIFVATMALLSMGLFAACETEGDGGTNDTGPGTEQQSPNLN